MDFPGGTVDKNPLAMQGTQVRSMVQEDSTCHGAMKPGYHDYWACVLQLLKAVSLEPVFRHRITHHNEKPRAPQLEKAHTEQQRPSATKK